MKTLGTIRIRDWDTQGDNVRKVVVNDSTILFGFRRFSQKQVFASLKRGRGRFTCEGWIYNWKVVGDGITVVANAKSGIPQPPTSRLSLSPLLVSKIRKWANP